METAGFSSLLYFVFAIFGVLLSIYSIHFFANYFNVKLNHYGIYILWIISCCIFLLLLPKKNNIFRAK